MSPVRAAAIQFDPQVGVENTAANLAETLRLINKAADAGANLIVLPELCNTGYSFSTREEAYAHAENVPGGVSTTAWTDLARERNLYVVAGLVELDGVFLYDCGIARN
jgi:predicted amidohydrolase